MANYRGGRINEEIKKDVSNTIQNKIKDPRLTAMVSVTEVIIELDTTLDKANHLESLFRKIKENDSNDN